MRLWELALCKLCLLLGGVGTRACARPCWPKGCTGAGCQMPGNAMLVKKAGKMQRPVLHNLVIAPTP